MVCGDHPRLAPQIIHKLAYDLMRSLPTLYRILTNLFVYFFCSDIKCDPEKR